MTALSSPERLIPKARVVPKYTMKSSTSCGMIRMKSRYTRLSAFVTGFFLVMSIPKRMPSGMEISTAMREIRMVTHSPPSSRMKLLPLNRIEIAGAFFWSAAACAAAMASGVAAASSFIPRPRKLSAKCRISRPNALAT